MEQAWKPGQVVVVATISGPRKAKVESQGRTRGVLRVRWEHNGQIALVDVDRIRAAPRPAARAKPQPRTEQVPDPVPLPAVPIAERRLATLKPVPKPRAPTRSETFLAWVREKPCASCRMPGPSDPHHYGPRGMGQKTDDHRVVPLCRACHDHFHQHARLPYLDKQTTKTFLLQRQVDLLVEWLAKQESEG